MNPFRFWMLNQWVKHTRQAKASNCRLFRAAASLYELTLSKITAIQKNVAARSSCLVLLDINGDWWSDLHAPGPKTCEKCREPEPLLV